MVHRKSIRHCVILKLHLWYSGEGLAMQVWQAGGVGQSCRRTGPHRPIEHGGMLRLSCDGCGTRAYADCSCPDGMTRVPTVTRTRPARLCCPGITRRTPGGTASRSPASCCSPPTVAATSSGTCQLMVAEGVEGGRGPRTRVADERMPRAAAHRRVGVPGRAT